VSLVSWLQTMVTLVENGVMSCGMGSWIGRSDESGLLVCTTGLYHMCMRSEIGSTWGNPDLLLSDVVRQKLWTLIDNYPMCACLIGATKIVTQLWKLQSLVAHYHKCSPVFGLL
jgi:hypothetical protein